MAGDIPLDRFERCDPLWVPYTPIVQSAGRRHEKTDHPQQVMTAAMDRIIERRGREPRLLQADDNCHRKARKFASTIGMRRHITGLVAYLHAYIDGCGLAADPKGPLFRTIERGRGVLTTTPLPQANAYAMIRRRAAAAGIETKIGNHTFRATGITAYLKNGGTLENAAAMANHASTRTTQLYDRRSEEISLDEIERVRI